MGMRNFVMILSNAWASESHPREIYEDTRSALSDGLCKIMIRERLLQINHVLRITNTVLGFVTTARKTLNAPSDWLSIVKPIP